ncbi:TetR/AcrR family transcriptional regulator [Marinilabilia salmonicolor]|uniref:TetR/AcrR family transcriptional regulator n=1 Tax=Marinilabilia salmonicolor TaxID=989 RepID=UPI00029AB1AB|nr:TetR/AcrR family transcriptional regulator [Marinilabilia salmonicolor]
MISKKNCEKEDTEELILKAARQVFVRKGYEGARMQEIADEAGINKALLHYYFRSKEKLFDKIFLEAFRNFWPSVKEELDRGKGTVKSLIKAAVISYTDLLMKMPFLPAFVIGEINRSPERMEDLLLATGINPRFVLDVIQKGIERGEVIPLEPRSLLINIVGLSLFPFISRPLLSRMFFESDEEYLKFLENRRTDLYEFICRSVLTEYQP